ncbi:uncharacterized protein LACBIDRAFT_330580 [Laccaria bicolor S238N-H82]|uniref:Predicted protein n=1 Tax=Laccaria bicolor (strain S238N-H82 / ATCC MYA-4686) TaxID=486041 RepID=B0DLS4_LACBS|nr:uncharacterized protein LACBIDRAFT_330580 [Laccaria bicolor S238N-H82]EDR04345.1 predicted protein [Laccaria bicolor S238N-H82]|eukprot:XP_001884864.1 predicted protein [Laccaria bicolor S238N-H82]
MPPLNQDSDDEIVVIFPNNGILPFDNLQTDTELNEVYGLVPPFDMGVSYQAKIRKCGSYSSPCPISGNWFAGAIKRHRTLEMKASRTGVSLDISRALDLPVELLLEIFEFLHPIDLYSVVRSSKKLRAILLNRRASAVWKEAFRDSADVLPPCPQDVSEPQWASMLFGPATCDDCGRKGAMIDFHLQWRLCQFCMGPSELYRMPYPLFYPTELKYDEEPKYLMRDIWKMNVKFSTFISDLETPGVEEAFEEFQRFVIDKASRRLEVKYARPCQNRCVDVIVQDAKKANAYMVRMATQVSEEQAEQMKRLIAHHTFVLLRRGHDQVDLNFASAELLGRYSYSERFKVNYGSFKKLALDVLYISEAHKVRRTLPPISWSHLPNEAVFLEESPFAVFIASESNEIGQLPEGSVQSDLVPFLSSWMQARESEIYANPYARMASPNNTNLELAVNVFVCPICDIVGTTRHTSVLIGLKDLRSHFRCLESPDALNFNFSFEGLACVLTLVGLLDMDPATATVDDLDARDARFFCETCEISRNGGVSGKQALTWRECISHVNDRKLLPDGGGHRLASWALLTTEATESIRRREQPYPNPGDHIWCCNHCPEHYDDATTKTKALRHATEERHLIPPRKPICVGYDPPEIYQCGKCPDTINRLWQIDRLKRHLLDKHQLTNPGPSDWRVVKIVEKALQIHLHSLCPQRLHLGKANDLIDTLIIAVNRN